MEEPLPIRETPPDAPQPPAMSLAARLLNVFAIPGEVFEGVRASRFYVGNWLLPVLLSAVVGVLTIIVILSQPSVARQVRELSEQQAKALEQRVKAGKVTRVEANHVQAVTRRLTDPATLKTIGSMAAVLFSVVRVFWWAFILWLAGRMFLKVQLGYLKALEVAGLALMISVLGGVVALALTVNLPRIFATPSLALVAPDFEATRKSPLMLGAANVFSFWLVGVLSVGLAKLARVPFLRAAWFVFAFWVIQQSLLIVVAGALGQFGL
ncbi:MAG: YIP1 family protein [Verrucomicrobiota bacterium]|jgi:hypothetical protein